MTENRDTGWNDPIDQVESLKAALKHLCSHRSRRARLDAATSALTKYTPDDFPIRIRQRFESIMQARVAVAKVYAGAPLFDFGLLGNVGCRAVEDDLIALFTACILDIGLMGAVDGRAQDHAELIYPTSESALRVRTHGRIRAR